MLQVGESVDNYTIEGVAGEGQTAVVYKVRDRTDGRTYALKVPRGRGAEVEEAMRREAAVQAQIRQANVVGVHGEVSVQGITGILMDLVDGPTLAAVIARGGITGKHIESVAIGLVEGLAEIHRRGVVHRDLRPSNILLEKRGAFVVPRITDFGVARKLSDTGHAGLIRELPDGAVYAAPELARNPDAVGPAADVFSLGAVLYHLVCRVPPFDPSSPRVLEEMAAGQFARPSRVAQVPSAVEDALIAALQPDPRRRAPDVETFRALWRGQAASNGYAVPTEVMNGRESASVPSRTSHRPAAPAAGTPRIAPPMLLDADADTLDTEPPASGSPSPRADRAAAPAPRARPAPQATTRRPPAGAVALVVAAVTILGVLLALAAVGAVRATASLGAAPLAAPPVSLTLESNPDGAAVYDGAEFIGRTPVALDPRREGRTLDLRMDGHVNGHFVVPPITDTESAVILLAPQPAAGATVDLATTATLTPRKATRPTYPKGRTIRPPPLPDR